MTSSQSRSSPRLVAKTAYTVGAFDELTAAADHDLDMTVVLRAATPADNAELKVLIERSTRALLRPFLSRGQIAASLELVTLDHGLIEDGIYFVAEDLGTLVACGGWGRRREYITPSGNGKPQCSLLEPPRDPARVRAMYTHPGHA